MLQLVCINITLLSLSLSLAFYLSVSHSLSLFHRSLFALLSTLAEFSLFRSRTRLDSTRSCSVCSLSISLSLDPRDSTRGCLFFRACSNRASNVFDAPSPPFRRDNRLNCCVTRHRPESESNVTRSRAGLACRDIIIREPARRRGVRQAILSLYGSRDMWE